MQRQRLGRGLKALLGEDADLFSGGLQEIPVELISPSSLQPRLDKEKGIEELVESVKQYGVLQPILVKKTQEGYVVVAGERRLIAAKKAGLEKVPAVVGEWDDKTSAFVALVENVQRRDISPLEEALFYRRLKTEFGLTQEEIAELSGKSRSHVANIMRIASLPDRIADALSGGKITLGHAKALLSLKDEKRMLEAFEAVVKKGLSVRETEELVKVIREKRSPEPVITLKSFPKVKVKVRKLKNNRVKLSIECTEFELEKLLERLNA